MAHPQHLLEHRPDPLDPAVHPRAVRQCPLMADTQPLQREGEYLGGGDRFVVGANRLGAAIMFDGIQQQSKNGD